MIKLIYLFFLLTFLYLIFANYPSLTKHDLISSRNYAHKSKIVLSISITFTALTIILTKIIILICHKILPSFTLNKTIMQTFVYGDVVFYDLSSQNTTPIMTMAVDLLIDIAVCVSAMYSYCTLAFKDDESLKSKPEMLSDTKSVQELYAYYKAIMSKRVIMFTICSICVAICAATSFDIKNFFLLATLCVAVLLSAFHYEKAADKAMKVITVICGMIAMVDYSEKIFEIINDKYRTFNFVDDYNANFIQYVNFGVIVLTFVLSSYYARFNVNDSLYEIKKFTVNNSDDMRKDIAMSKSKTYFVIKNIKRILSPLSALMFKVYFIIWNMFHVCGLLFFAFVYFIFGMNKKRRTFNDYFIKPSFIVANVYTLGQYVFNITERFNLFSRKSFAIFEAIGFYKYYKNELNADYTNSYDLNKNCYKKIKGFLFDFFAMMIMCVLMFFEIYKNKNVQDKNENKIEISSKIVKFLHSLYKNYIMIFFILIISLIKFDVLHFVYFSIFFIMLLSNKSRDLLWNILVYYNIAVLIVVIYFWNIFFVFIIDMNDISPFTATLLKRIGLLTDSSSHFILEYAGHIALFTFAMIHNHFTLNSRYYIKHDKSVSFQWISNKTIIFVEICLLTILCVLPHYTFSGLFITMITITVTFFTMLTQRKISMKWHRFNLIVCIAYATIKYINALAFDIDITSTHSRIKIILLSIIVLLSLNCYLQYYNDNSEQLIPEIKNFLINHSGTILIMTSAFIAITLSNFIGVMMLLILTIAFFCESSSNWYYSYMPIGLLSLGAITFIYLSHISFFFSWMNADFTWLGVYEYKNITLEVLPYIILVDLCGIKYHFNTTKTRSSYILYYYGYYIGIVTITILAFVQNNLFTIITLLFIASHVIMRSYHRSGYKTKGDIEFSLNKKAIAISWKIFSYVMIMIAFLQFVALVWFPSKFDIPKPWHKSSFNYLCDENGKTSYSSDIKYKGNSDYVHCVNDWNTWIGFDNKGNTMGIFALYLIGIISMLISMTIANDEYDSQAQIFLPNENEDFTYLSNRVNNTQLSILYFIFCYYRAFALIISITFAMIFACSYLDMFSLTIIIMCISFLLSSKRIQKLKNNQWSLLTATIISFLILISIYQFPLIPCSLPSTTQRVYLPKDECISLYKSQYSNMIYNISNIKALTDVYTLFSALSGLIKLNFSLACANYMYLFIAFAFSLSIEIILSHPYQYYVDDYYAREKKFNRKAKAFYEVASSHLTHLKKWRKIYNDYYIMNQKISKLKNENEDEEKMLIESEDKLKQKCNLHLENKFVKENAKSYFAIIKNEFDKIYNERIKEYQNIIKSEEENENKEKEEKFILDLMIEINDVNKAVNRIQTISDYGDVFFDEKFGLNIAKEEYKTILTKKSDKVKDTCKILKYDLLYTLFYPSNKEQDSNDEIIKVNLSYSSKNSKTKNKNSKKLNSYNEIILPYKDFSPFFVRKIKKVFASQIDKALLIDLNPQRKQTSFFELDFIDLIPMYIITHIEIITAITIIIYHIHSHSIISMLFPLSFICFAMLDSHFISNTYINLLLIFSIIAFISSAFYQIPLAVSFSEYIFGFRKYNQYGVFLGMISCFVMLIAVLILKYKFKVKGISKYVNKTDYISSPIFTNRNNNNNNSDNTYSKRFIQYIHRIIPEMFSYKNKTQIKIGTNYYISMSISLIILLLYLVILFPFIYDSPINKVYYAIAFGFCIMILCLDRIAFKLRRIQISDVLASNYNAMQKFKSKFLNINNDNINDISHIAIIPNKQITISNIAIIIKIIVHIVMFIFVNILILFINFTFALQLAYFIFCIYSIFSALQIANGYAIQNTLNNCNTKVNYLPFISEIASVFDWCIQYTSLKFNQWIFIEETKKKIKSEYKQCNMFSLLMVFALIIAFPFAINSLRGERKSESIDKINMRMYFTVQNENNNTMFYSSLLNPKSLNVVNIEETQMAYSKSQNANINPINNEQIEFSKSQIEQAKKINNITNVNSQLILSFDVIAKGNKGNKENILQNYPLLLSHNEYSQIINAIINNANFTSFSILHHIPSQLWLNNGKLTSMNENEKNEIKIIFSIKNKNLLISLISSKNGVRISHETSSESPLTLTNILIILILAFLILCLCLRLIFSDISKDTLLCEQNEISRWIEGIELFREFGNYPGEAYAYSQVVKSYKNQNIFFL